MLTEFLIWSAIKLGAFNLLSFINNKIKDICLSKDFTDNIYGYKRKLSYFDKFSHNDVMYFPKDFLYNYKELFKNIILLFPILGDLMFFSYVIRFPIYVYTYMSLTNDLEVLKFYAKADLKNYEMPDEHLVKLRKGEDLYKSISDSLKIEGLKDSEINSFMKDVSKADASIRPDNNNEIIKAEQRVTNLMLLDPLKDYLLNPKKAYKYTLDKKIQKVKVEDDFVIIGVSDLGADDVYDENVKIEPDVKMLTKKFKLKH